MRHPKTEELFLLVKAMNKSEKRNFSLYAKRNTDKDDLKVIALYKAIDRMDVYCETKFQKSFKASTQAQLPNLKQQLYKLLLDSMRLIRAGESVEMQLHQLMDYAKILYSKGFYQQTLKVLRKIKEHAISYQQVSFRFQAVVFEKKIELVNGNCETLTINKLNKEMEECNHQLQLIGRYSNLSMVLYGLYTRNGPLRNETNLVEIEKIFHGYCLVEAEQESFYPRLYLSQCYTYYFLLKNDRSRFFAHANEWVKLFTEYPQMKKAEHVQYERGLLYMNEAAFLMGHNQSLQTTAALLKESDDPFFKLLSLINMHLASYGEVGNLFYEVDEFLEQENKNEERNIVLAFKAAILSMKQKNYSRVIDYCNAILNAKSDARIDLQYEARLIHIEAHKQIGNNEIIEYLNASARRFFVKCAGSFPVPSV